jgi:hypothetical protein
MRFAHCWLHGVPALQLPGGALLNLTAPAPVALRVEEAQPCPPFDPPPPRPSVGVGAEEIGAPHHAMLPARDLQREERSLTRFRICGQVSPISRNL